MLGAALALVAMSGAIAEDSKPGSNATSTSRDGGKDRGSVMSPIRLDVGAARHQVFVHITGGPKEYVCLANRGHFDEDKREVLLEGDVLVETRGRRAMDVGQRITVYPAKGFLAGAIPDRGRAASAQETGGIRAAELWEKYKAEFLVRMGGGMCVILVSGNAHFRPACGGDGAECHVQAANPIVGAVDGEPKSGDTVYLYPFTAATKVILVKYYGQEDRNWIPYDEGLELRLKERATTLERR
jgi:hypothetical protein